MKWGAKVFGLLAGALIVYLALGLLLPGTWTAQAEALVSAPPDKVFPYLSSTDRWVLWNVLPSSGLESEGPREGVGAALRWDDPQYGSGRFRIVEIEARSRMAYEVSIEGGTLTVRGSLELSGEGDGTRILWTEEGDFGWNPLLGYAARGMASSQRDAMNASLEKLRSLLNQGEAGT